MIKNINDRLNLLWAQDIKKIDYDFFKGTITIYISGESEVQYIITFTGVSSFLWIRNSVGTVVDFEESMYSELTSISVGKANINLKNDKWLKYYNINPNILIEIVDSAMLIQAKEIIFNGENLFLSE